MASWICQTRKLLSAAIHSIADDLEQTVQDFNDVVFRYSSSGATTSAQSMSERTRHATTDEQPTLDEELVLTSSKERRNLKDDKMEARISYIAATTRQPETVGFTSALNTRLSQSSPALQVFEDSLQQSMDVDSHSLGMAEDSLSSWKPRFSVSSPCLLHISELPSTDAILGTGHTQSANIECQSSVWQRLTDDRPTSSHICHCHNSEYHKTVPNTHSIRHPGKVVRAQTLTIAKGRQEFPSETSKDRSGQELPSETSTDRSGQELPSETSKDRLGQELPSGTSTDESGQKLPSGTSTDGSGQQFPSGTSTDGPEDETPSIYAVDQINENSVRQISSPLILERHRSPLLHWPVMLPFTRILSFAFSHFANVFLMLTEESRNVHSFNSREALSLRDRERGVRRDESQSDDLSRPLSNGNHTSLEEDERRLSAIIGRTYSTESFEIIGASSVTSSAEEREGHYDARRSGQRRHQDLQGVATKTDGSCEFAWGQLDSEDECKSVGQGSESLSVSTDFFDFRKLITDREFPADFGNSAVTTDHLRADNLTDSFVILDNSLSNVSNVPNDKSDSDDNKSDKRDDDTDSSASFVILSDNDDDCEFIFS